MKRPGIGLSGVRLPALKLPGRALRRTKQPGRMPEGAPAHASVSPGTPEGQGWRGLRRLAQLPAGLRGGVDRLRAAGTAGAARIGSWPRRSALLAALGYLALVLLLAHTALSAVGGLLEKRDAVATADEILGRLQGRRPAAASAAPSVGPPLGSPFLEGPSVTIAGANLMQRVGAAVTRADGRILSSRVELQGADLGPGFVGVSVNFDMGQSAIQGLLHDLEAGMPFLFVDQLVVQGPSASAGGEGDTGRLRVLLTVYGQWQGTP